MARKGKEIQLQREIETQEEWEDMLSKEGLCVVDVYQAWCGLCSGMTSTLRKYRNDMNDDLLQLFAIKDTVISQLEEREKQMEEEEEEVEGTLCTPETSDSDEVQEMFCEQCYAHENMEKPAVGYCMDCQEYMCVSCLKYHKRYEINHTTQLKDKMPQDFCLEKCSMHRSKFIKFYCEDCQQFLCSECSVKHHKDCAKIYHLPWLVKEIDSSKELKALRDNLYKMSKELDRNVQEINNNLQKVVVQEKHAMAVTKKLKENFLATFSRDQKTILDNFDMNMEETIANLKKEREVLVGQAAEKQKHFEATLNNDEKCITDKVTRAKSTDQKRLQSIQDKNMTIKQELDRLSTDLVLTQTNGERCKLFMKMKLAQEEVRKMETDMKELKETVDIHLYYVKNHVEGLDHSGLQTADTYFSYRELPANTHTDIKMKSLCDLTSLCLLNDNTLLGADVDGQTLIMVKNLNTSTHSFDAIKVPFRPWGITRTEENEVAVTFPYAKIVGLFTFSVSMTVEKSVDVKVEDGCHGIAYCNDNLIVSYTCGKVQILDMNGKILSSFEKDCNGRSLFCSPNYLALSPDSKTLYVSDWGRHTVTSMTLDGKVKAIYKDDQLSRPHQLAVDEAGTVYVCGELTNNVHQLSPGLTKADILLDKRQEMIQPVTIAYCKNNSRLYVGRWNSQIIKVFNLSLEHCANDM